MSETVRTVKTEFTAEDKGLGAHQERFAHAFQQGAEHLSSFRQRLSEFRREQGLMTLSAMGLGYGVGAWLSKIKEANAEYGRAKSGIAGVLAGSLAFEKGASEVDRYRRSLTLANDVVEDADETAARFGLQLEDVTTIYKKLALSVGGLGLSQKNVSDLMVSTAATARRFGVSGETAADTIARAMKTGTVRGVDEFSISLAKAAGNMHKLTQAQRFEALQKALQGSVGIADEMSKNIGGALGRIRNVVEDTLRDLTKPIFGDVAKKLEAWGKHLREAREGAKPLIEEISGKLLTAFQTISDVVGKIREHWMAIAGVIAGMKMSNFAANLATQAASIAASGAPGSAQAAGIRGGAGGVVGKVAKVTIMAEAAYLVGSALGDLVAGKMQKATDQQERTTDVFGKLGTLGAILKNASPGQTLAANQMLAAQKAIGSLEKAGVVIADKTGKYSVDVDKLRQEYHSSNFDQTQSSMMRRYLGTEGVWADKVPERIAETVSRLFPLVGTKPLAETSKDPERKFAKQVVNNNFNGGIHVQWKNEEPDPDRAFVRFTGKLENYVHNRTQAATAEALGD